MIQVQDEKRLSVSWGIHEVQLQNMYKVGGGGGGHSVGLMAAHADVDET